MKTSLVLAALILVSGFARSENADTADLTSRVAKLEQRVAQLEAAAGTPHAAPSKPQALGPETFLKILADGSLQLGNVNGTDEEIFAALKTLLETHPTARIRISGADNTKYQRVVEAIDLCQRCGIVGISFKTDRPSANDNSKPPTP